MNQMPVIEIKNVSKSFKEIEAVKNLTLTIYEGEYVALLGPNGAGKTTLIEMIEGLQKPDAGTVLILGMNWKEHEQKLHQKIGLSLQETKFIDKITTKETLDLFGSFYGLSPARTEEILELVNLTEKRKAYTSQLSGGQRQRLAIGIALLNNPKVLLLDEPTTGLDPGARREVWKILEKLQRDFKTTMILTTHYMEEAEILCERILIMDKGEFIAAGTLPELSARHGEGGCGSAGRGRARGLSVLERDAQQHRREAQRSLSLSGPSAPPSPGGLACRMSLTGFCRKRRRRTTSRCRLWSTRPPRPGR